MHLFVELIVGCYRPDAGPACLADPAFALLHQCPAGEACRRIDELEDRLKCGFECGENGWHARVPTFLCYLTAENTEDAEKLMLLVR